MTRRRLTGVFLVLTLLPATVTFCCTAMPRIVRYRSLLGHAEFLSDNIVRKDARKGMLPIEIYFTDTGFGPAFSKWNKIHIFRTFAESPESPALLNDLFSMCEAREILLTTRSQQAERNYQPIMKQDEIVRMAKCESLESVSISGHVLDAIDFTVLPKRIRHLSIENCHISREIRWGELPELMVFKLSVGAGSFPGDVSSILLAAAPNLKKCHLSCGTLSDDSLYAISQFQSVEELIISGTRIDGMWFASFSFADSITWLGVKDLVPDPAIADFFGKAHKLLVLHIRSDAFDDQCLLSVVNAARRLIFLSVESNSITDTSFALLPQLTSLKMVGFACPKVSSVVVDQVRSKLKGTKIVRFGGR